MTVFIILFTSTFAISLLPLIISNDKKVWLSFLLSFSGAFLLGVTLLHIIPELYEEHATSFQVGVFVMVGFFIQVILESYSKGIEHGHIHIHDFGKMPYGLFLALSLHALLEGSLLNEVTVANNLEIMFGILIHKIPVAFLLGLLLFSLKTNKFLSISLLAIFAICTPIGGIITSNINNIEVFSIPLDKLLTALATGSFLHVSTTILFETSPEHKLKINKFIPALIGGALAIGTALLPH